MKESQFLAEARYRGGSLTIIIPPIIIKYLNIKKDDLTQITIKKMKK